MRNLTFQTPTLDQETFRALRDLIYERSGIYFPDNKRYLLESRLAGLLEEGEFESFQQYLYFLRYDALREREFAKIFDAVTTHETSFFREPTQLQALEEELLPRMIQEKEARGETSLKLWSAACSTGEEPYTLAMILMERFPRILKTWSVEILASDISESALRAARQGCYGNYSIRNTPPVYLQKYFVKTDGKYQVVPEIRRLVRFTHLNLYETSRVRMIRNVDLLFCRNVLIHFSDEAKRQVVSALYDCLAPGGYLIIGHSESLYNVSRAFRLVQIRGALFYQKQA